MQAKSSDRWVMRHLPPSVPSNWKFDSPSFDLEQSPVQNGVTIYKLAYQCVYSRLRVAPSGCSLSGNFCWRFD
jgi:hypothetical protein